MKYSRYYFVIFSLLISKSLFAQNIREQLNNYRFYTNKDFTFEKLGDGRLVLVARYNEFDLFDLSANRILTTVNIPKPIAFKASDDGRYFVAVDYGVYEGKYDSRIKIYDLSKQYEEKYNPMPLVTFHENLGISKYSYLRFINETLIAAGANAVSIFNISNKSKVHEITGLSNVTTVAFLSKTKTLDVYEQSGLKSIDISGFISDIKLAEQANTKLDSKTRIDYLLNLAGLKKASFNTGSIEILSNPQLQYTHKTDGFDYFGSYSYSTGKITFASRVEDSEVEFAENIGKVKYSKNSMFKSSLSPNQYTEVSSLKSKFDGSVKLFFQDFHIENSSIFKKNEGFKYDIKVFEPMRNPIDRKVSFFRLTNGNILAVMNFVYDSLNSRLYKRINPTAELVGAINGELLRYKNIRSGTFENVPWGVRTGAVTQLVSFSPDGKSIISKQTYMLTEDYNVRLGPNGSFAIIASKTGNPVLLQNTAVTLREYSDKNGITVAFFSSDLFLKKFEQIDVKKDQRIKDSRLIAATSNLSKLMILFASNQTGSINEESLTANLYNFDTFSFETQLVNENWLKIEPYFSVTSSFFDEDIVYYVKSSFAGGGSYDHKCYKIDLSKSYFKVEEIPYTYFKAEP